MQTHVGEGMMMGLHTHTHTLPAAAAACEDNYLWHRTGVGAGGSLIIPAAATWRLYTLVSTETPPCSLWEGDSSLIKHTHKNGKVKAVAGLHVCVCTGLQTNGHWRTEEECFDLYYLLLSHSLKAPDQVCLDALYLTLSPAAPRNKLPL